MSDGQENTKRRNAPDEYKRITLEIDLEIPVWHDTGCDGEPVASICGPHESDFPWKIAPDAVSKELAQYVEDEFSFQLQEAAAKEAEAIAEDRKRFRGMSEDEYMERLRERRNEK